MAYDYFFMVYDICLVYSNDIQIRYMTIVHTYIITKISISSNIHGDSFMSTQKINSIFEYCPYDERTRTINNLYTNKTNITVY